MVLAEGPVVNAGDDQGLRIRRLTTRSRVSLLTGSINRLAKLAAGLPPSASPRWWTMHSSRAVRRDRVVRTSSPNRSAKIRRRQCGTSQTNRRVITRRRTCLPADGRSATSRWYRLWIRRDLAPHNGHSAIPASDRTAKIIESDESLTLSITNPLGTSDEIRIPARMALIPSLENRKLGRKLHRM
jgi:hypothetical protein